MQSECVLQGYPNRTDKLKSSPLIEDAMLKAMAPHLRELKRLTLWGCTRITKAGVSHILHAADFLEELSLDALPHSVIFPIIPARLDRSLILSFRD